MQSIKRMISCLLVVCLCVSFTFPAYAAEDVADTENNNKGISERVLRFKVQEKENEIYALVYDQLEAQGAEDMFDTYKALLSPEIEREVYQEYGYSVNSVSSTSYNFPYGGVVGYTSYLGTQVTVTYMDLGCTYKYVLTSGSTIARTVITNLLGFVPNWGYPFSILLGLTSRLTESAKVSIHNAGGRGYIMSVHDPTTMSDSSVLVGWSSYPSAVVASGATGISRNAFPQNNHSHYNGAGY